MAIKQQIVNDSVSSGKSVFFVCPNQAIREQLAHKVFMQEYVVYTINSLEEMIELAQKFDDALIYINIDAFEVETDTPAWQKAIKTLFTENKSKQIKIGIITINNDYALRTKCIYDCRINSSFISLSNGYEEGLNLILKTLKVYNARGRRQYVRANCRAEDNVYAELEYGGLVLRTQVLNISSSSLAVRVDESINIPIGEILDSMKIHFNNEEISAKVKLFGARNTQDENQNCKELIWLFSNDDEWKQSDALKFIYTQIYRLIQQEIFE